MRPSRIQLSGVSSTLLILLLSGAASLLPARSMSQCTGTLGSITYDTVYNGTSASSSFNYTLPEFPPSSLTLYAVTFKATVSVSAAVTIFNVSGNPIAAPGVQLFRSDGFNSSVTGSKSGSVVAPSTPVTGPPLANSSLETIPLPNAVNNVQIFNDSLTPANTSGFGGFTGAGTIPVTYSTSDIALPQNAGVFATGTAVTDHIHFTITYFYCDPGPLALDLVAFTAVRENQETIRLNWITSNEQLGRKYDVQVSQDGANFVSYASQNADPVNKDANYTYAYPVAPSAKGKVFFRLRLIDEIGANHYSAIRTIDLGAGETGGFYLYPNPPSDYVQLTFPAASTGWQVDILAADGSLVQRNYYPNSTQARVNFARKMPSGTYFARATDAQSNKSYVKSFVIR